MAKPYWAYIEFEDDLVSDLGEYDTLTEALEAVGNEIWTRSEVQPGANYHIVDNTTSTTVWIAGPGNTITAAKGYSVMDEPVSR